MPFSVLKLSKNSSEAAEVVGEFPDEAEANEFAEAAQMMASDDDCDYEYVVEAPPSQAD